MAKIKTERHFREKPLYRVDSEGGAASIEAYGDKCELHSMIAYNLTATAGYLQIHDADELPADEAVPLITIPFPASSAVSLDRSIPIYCENGLVVAVSTTAEDLTISTNEAMFLVNVLGIEEE